MIDQPWGDDVRFATRDGRLEHEVELDERMAVWTMPQDKFAVQKAVLAAGVPCAAVQTPEERVDLDPGTEAFGLWPDRRAPRDGPCPGRRPAVPPLRHRLAHGARRAPCLGEHNDLVFGDVLGLSPSEIAELREQGVI